MGMLKLTLASEYRQQNSNGPFVVSSNTFKVLSLDDSGEKAAALSSCNGGLTNSNCKRATEKNRKRKRDTSCCKFCKSTIREQFLKI